MERRAPPETPPPHTQSLIRTVCFVTSNRSDWSKLQPVAKKLSDLEKSPPSKGPKVKVEIIALGSHMLQELGGTFSEVQKDFPTAHGLFTIVAGDSTHSMADSVGFGITKVTSSLRMINPDILVIHGDRFDAFSVAVAANMMLNWRLFVFQVILFAPLGRFEICAMCPPGNSSAIPHPLFLPIGKINGSQRTWARPAVFAPDSGFSAAIRLLPTVFNKKGGHLAAL